MNKKNENSLIKTYKEIGPYIGLGSQLAATIILMIFLGMWLDEKLELKPVLTIVFSLLGGFAGIYNFIKSTIKTEKRNKVE